MKLSKSLLLSIAVLISSFSLFAQEEQKKDTAYVFTRTVDLKNTCVKDQQRAGTCWSYSTLSFFESELFRMGKGEYDLAPMYVARKTYTDKAEKFVRMHGKVEFSQGGSFADVKRIIQKYGMIPEKAYPGNEYGEDKHAHSELEGILKGYVNAVIKNPNRKLSTAWMRGYNGVLDAYFGDDPVEFEIDGKKYTPKSYAKESGLDMENYVSLTSYTHHPFYSSFVIEVPDNWRDELSYNLPLDEFIKVFDNALTNGYSIAWGSDVSERGFSWKNGVAIVPDEDGENMTDSEKLKWEGLSKTEKNKQLYKFEGPVKEKIITQELRQEGFDNYTTQDDHGMHITGMAKDQNGSKYYIVKNSWGTDDHIYDGYFYASEAFVKYKTMNILIHKDAIPKDLRKKLGL